MNKKHLSISTGTNLLLILFFIIGNFIHQGFISLVEHTWGAFIMSISLYGLSGSLTNSLAIKMIFDKIPFVWGSGIIEKNFSLFQVKLKETLMEHLFNEGFKLESLDVEMVADRLHEQLQHSQLGMITRFITPLALTELLKEMDLPSIISQSLPPEMLEAFIAQQVQKLSPNDVKLLILKIMDEHLEWLIIWGAIFGVAIGLISYLLIGAH